MQIQEIITYLIIAFASVVVLFSLYRAIFQSVNKSNEHGCSSGCNCDAKVVRKDLLSKKKIIGSITQTGNEKTRLYSIKKLR